MRWRLDGLKLRTPVAGMGLCFGCDKHATAGLEGKRPSTIRRSGRGRHPLPLCSNVTPRLRSRGCKGITYMGSVKAIRLEKQPNQ